MKRFVSLLLFVSVVIGAFIILLQKRLSDNSYELFLLREYQNNYRAILSDKNEVKPDNPHLAAFQDYYATIDPTERRIPKNRLRNAYNSAIEGAFSTLKSTGDKLFWAELPSDMGGRVRSFMFDPNDPTHKKVWAGSVTGGLWYNNNIDYSLSDWMPVNDFWESLSVSSIVSDPQNSQIFYAGTGEAQTAVTIYRESSSRGVGIYKTEDGGKTWQLLPSTSEFVYITDIALRVEDDTTVIYAGVVSGVYKGQDHRSNPTDGLYRSKDGGNSWSQVLPDISGETMPYSPSDLEVNSSGRIFVGTHRNVEGVGGGTILWSDNGIDWTVYDEYKTIIENSGNPVSEIPGRVILSSTPADPDAIFAVVTAGGYTRDDFIYYRGMYIIKSLNNGANWTEVNPPIEEGYWSTLAWHALTLQIDPEDANTIFAGGLDLHKTSDGGATWRQQSSWSNFGDYAQPDKFPYVHADQHKVVFKPGSRDTVYFCTDGGVFATYNGQDDSLLFTERNQGFNSLQFYTAAIHPHSNTNYYVSGTQDNGTLISNRTAISVDDDMISGGDGAFCFFDHDNPNLLITSVYHNQYYTNERSGNSYFYKDVLYELYGTGIFINPADYSSANNALFANATTFALDYADSLCRYTNINETNYAAEIISANTGSQVPFSAVKLVSDNGNELFVGNQIGELYRLSNIYGIISSEEITGSQFPEANIACIESKNGGNDLLILFSNYGVFSVWYSGDGGQSWTEKEGNLPDIPVRWGVFNPIQEKGVILATELGIWTCADITQDEITWQKNEDFPNVRVDMIRTRAADSLLLVASHGRGMFLGKIGKEVPSGVSKNSIKSESLAFTVYPNPARDFVKVKMANPANTSSSVKIYGIGGKLYYQTSIAAGIEESIIDLSEFPKGNYLFTLEYENQIQTEQIIIQ